MKACDRAPKRSGYILFIIILAILIKFSLFVFVSIHAPQGKIMPDSDSYIKLSEMIVSKGIFALNNERGVVVYETLRTPGYPIFLALLNGVMKITLNGIVFIQIVMTLLAALVIYKTSLEIDPRIAFLSMVILLFDPPITIFSLVVLTETLFMFLMAMFVFCFTVYLKHGNIRFLILSAILAAASAYVRPIGYYLGIAMTFFIIYSNRKRGFKKIIVHALVFVVVVYSILGAWQARNYLRCGKVVFSSLEHFNLSDMGLIKSYVRNADPQTKDFAPLPYYVNVSFRCLMSLMTRPGSLKYLHSDILTAIGKILAYPWMAFWLVGFVWGVTKIRNNIYMQFVLYAALYFIAVSICGAMWIVGERFRVPIMPFIAIISAYGWLMLFKYKRY
jgi:hypothetical protein